MIACGPGRWIVIEADARRYWKFHCDVISALSGRMGGG